MTLSKIEINDIYLMVYVLMNSAPTPSPRRIGIVNLKREGAKNTSRLY
jgi:hypothetical protein